MIEKSELLATLADSPLVHWNDTLPGLVEKAIDPARHGDIPGWLETIAALPNIVPSSLDLAAPSVRIGTPDDVNEATRGETETLLRRLHPWRKGPFDLFGIHIDTEWRSDGKWARLAGAIQPLAGRTVLDVGCGNGYYALRTLGAGARRVIGVDPTLRYVAQFRALRHFTGPLPAHVLPLPLEALPAADGAFDTVFSMGVLYHRRDPQEHLQRLRRYLRPGGELVLEGLVIDGKEGEVLVPNGRYAKMKNVFAIPSPGTLLRWVHEAGYRDGRIVDVSPTTAEEQRRTDWMTFESLADFLDPTDPNHTVEGHPAPVRAIVVATAGG